MTTRSLKSVATTLIVAGFVGPAIFAAGVFVLGGDPLDGFLGSQRTNSSAQDAFLNTGYFVTVAVAVIGVVVGLIVAVRNLKNDWRSIFMPLYPLIGIGCCFLTFVISNLI